MRPVYDMELSRMIDAVLLLIEGAAARAEQRMAHEKTELHQTRPSGHPARDN